MFRFFSYIILAFVLVACSGATATPEPTSTIEPTIEVTEVSASAVHHLDTRRPGAPGACTQNGCQDERAGARCALLRKHRGWPRRSGEQRASGVYVSAGLHFSVEGTLVIAHGRSS